MAVTLTQLLIPTPEAGRGIPLLPLLEATAAEIELEVLGPLAEDRLQQLAIGAGLHQVDRLGVTGEFALDRDVAPLAQRRWLFNELQQVGRAAHVTTSQ